MHAPNAPRHSHKLGNYLGLEAAFKLAQLVDRCEAYTSSKLRGCFVARGESQVHEKLFDIRPRRGDVSQEPSSRCS